MHIADKILEARNALALCESLTLEAYVTAPDGLARPLRDLLISLASDREALARLHQAASTLPRQTAERTKLLLRARDLLDS